ncbi:MAG: hypothetical protein K2Q09_05275 [Phycisphaerales bacterium]|nr:hypothetical protein [Phycisphaerales bacterium]
MQRTRLASFFARSRVHGRAARLPAPAATHRKQCRYTRPGKIRGALLMWLLGVPIPLILLFFMIKGCVT